jgi:hypothetical protein
MGKRPRNAPPPPNPWKTPLERAIEDIDVPIEELVEIARDSVVNWQNHLHPLPPPGSGERRYGKGWTTGKGPPPTRPPARRDPLYGIVSTEPITGETPPDEIPGR